jgi:hypothetical protein
MPWTIDYFTYAITEPRLREMNLEFVRGVCGAWNPVPITILGAGNLKSAPAPSVINSLHL